MVRRRPASQIERLLRILDEAFDRKGWHGPTLRGSIRGVDVEEALWRPAAGRHNIWEIVLHTAYWKYAAVHRLRGDRRGDFPRKGSNWIPLPEVADRRAWLADLRLLVAAHAGLQRAILELPARDLEKPWPGSPWTNATLIYGIAAHDAYHAGQIQLLKRLRRS